MKTHWCALGLVVFSALLTGPTAVSAAIAVQNKSNKTIWVACAVNGLSRGSFANDFTAYDDFVGGFSIAPGESKTILDYSDVDTAWLHVTVNNQSYLPPGVASFKLDTASIIQFNRANPKQTVWIFMVPASTNLSAGGATLQKGDTAKSLDGRTLSALPQGGQVSVSNPGNIPTAVKQRGSISFFKFSPSGTYVYNGQLPAPVKPPAAPPKPPQGKPTPPGQSTVAIPISVKLKNDYGKRAIFTLKTDKGPGMATSLAPGETKTFSLLGEPGVTPTVSVQQPAGGVKNFRLTPGGDHVLRLNGANLQLLVR